MVSVPRGPFVLVASIVVGCLALGVALVSFSSEPPALVVSVLLSCAVASLLYGILGGVSEAGFDLGPLKVGGSAAVLLGLFNQQLAPQLEQIRAERYDFDDLADPPDGWFAVDDGTGVPVVVEFVNPVEGKVAETVTPPESASLRFRLSEQPDARRYLVHGGSASENDALGYVEFSDLVDAVGPIRNMVPAAVYGPTRLYLEGASGTTSSWGTSGPCRGTALPMLIEVERFHDGFAEYRVVRCGSNRPSSPDHSSSLAGRQGEVIDLVIEGAPRIFLVAVVAADHQRAPFWSSFLVIEMVSR